MDDYLASCMSRSELLQKLVADGRVHPAAFEPIPIGQIALEIGAVKRPGRPRKHPDRKAYRAEWLRKDRRDHPEKYGKPAKGKRE